MISSNQLIAAAVAYQKAGRHDAAESAYRAVLARDPLHAGALFGSGLVMLARGRPTEGVALIEQAIDTGGEKANVCFGLGCALAAAGRLADAAAAFGRSVALDPNLADAHHGLGRTLAEQGDPGAVASYRRAVALQPRMAALWNDLGIGYVATGQAASAAHSFERALAVEPAHSDALQNRALDLFKRNRQTLGLGFLRRALALAPAVADAQHQYAIAASSLGAQPAGLAGFCRARALAPSNNEIYGNYLFFLAHLPGFGFAEHFRENRRWGRWVEAQVTPATDFPNTAVPDRRLRLGYVSPELVANHNQLSWLMPLLLNHDRREFEIVCYGDVARADAGTAEVMALSDAYRSIYGLPEAEQARIVRMDRIDIAVNLCGWLAAKRALFAWRLAPIQVAYDNHVTTTGLTAVDYRITDAWVDPPGVADPWYTERLIRLETGYASQLEPKQAPDIDELPAARAGWLTFGSFNQLTKITEEAVALWASILLAVPGSRLLMKALTLGDAAVQAQWRGRFAAAGLEPHRLIFVGAVPDLADHYRAIAQADIALDPFPFTGGKSTCDALWMGVPVISLEGNCQIGRIGTSLLNRSGLGDLVAPDPDSYRAKVIALARDLDRLRELRRTMRAKLRQHGLFDGKRHTCELEAAYRETWRRWCKQLRRDR